MPLVLQLLGTVQVSWDDRPLKFATEHSRALLAYLAVEADKTHPRAILATLLWPEEREAAARQNLRQALVFLKQGLRSIPERDQLLQVTTTTMQWNSQRVTVDLDQLQQLYRLCQTHNHTNLQACPHCIERMSEAVTLYRGEFLSGLAVKQSQPFEEWSLFLREQTHRQVAEMLETIAAHHLAQGDYDQAQQYATRLMTLEPWHEAAHRQLMRALAAKGQQSAALRQYEACRHILQQELGVPPSAKTTKLYEQIRAGQVQTASSVSETRPIPPLPPKRLHNLPTHLAPLVGRRQRLEQLRTLVFDPNQRLITIVGMGGMGKTRLALALMEQLIAEAQTPFAQGIWFVSLVGVTGDGSDLPFALARTINNTLDVITADQENPQVALQHFLATRQLLLILDNLEHLLLAEESAALVTEFLLALLQAAPAVTLLTTSRMPLQLWAEAVVRLEGLPIPILATQAERAQPLSVGNEENDASVRLFIQHAQRTSPSFKLNPTDYPYVIEICRLLGGLPLAIELAAALTIHFAPEELAAAIRQNLALLVSNRRDIDVRHRHLSAVLESSWQLLSVQEARVLMQSAIFVGDFSRAAAAAVTGSTPLELTSLLEKSLLQQRAVGHYGLHELLRQFANQQLTQLGDQELAALQARYVDFYLGLIAQSNQQLRRPGAQAVLAQLRQISTNCHQSWQIALERGWLEPMVAALDAWSRYWQMTGNYLEGETLIAAALARLESTHGEPTLSVQRQSVLAKLWLNYARCLMGQERLQGSMEAVQKAITFAATCGEEEMYAQGAALCSTLLSLQSRHAEAHVYAEQAFQSEVWEAQIYALINLASAGIDVHAYVACIDQALQLAQQHADPYLTLLCITEVAGGYENAGYYADSLPYRHQALELAHTIQDIYQIGDAHYCYGLVHAHLGLYATAIEHFQLALRIAQEQSFVWLERRALNRLARSHFCLGEVDIAYQYSTQVQSLLYNEDRASSFFEFNHAQILVGLARWREAEHIYQQILARKRAENVVAVKLLPELAELARLKLWRGEAQTALALVEEILHIQQSYPRVFTPDLYFDVFAVDFACYEVLHTLHDPRAHTLLEASHQRLCCQVEQMVDPVLSRAYLENVGANHKLHQAYLHTLPTHSKALP